MGPALTEVFRDLGAEVIAEPSALDQDPALPAAIVSVALELVQHGIQINAIAQNFVEGEGLVGCGCRRFGEVGVAADRSRGCFEAPSNLVGPLVGRTP